MDVVDVVLILIPEASNARTPEEQKQYLLEWREKLIKAGWKPETVDFLLDPNRESPDQVQPKHAFGR